MSFHHCPDCRVPPSDVRCEAMTKFQPTGYRWQHEPHRCVRKAVQGRDGHSVCANHSRVKDITYWDGKSPDKFEHRNPNRRNNV